MFQEDLWFAFEIDKLYCSFLGTGDSKVEYKACSAIDKAICQDMTLGVSN